MIIAGSFMVAAYYFAEGIMYGNWVTPLLGVPWNIGQFAAGMVIAVAIAAALCKTPGPQLLYLQAERPGAVDHKFTKI